MASNDSQSALVLWVIMMDQIQSWLIGIVVGCGNNGQANTPGRRDIGLGDFHRQINTIAMARRDPLGARFSSSSMVFVALYMIPGRSHRLKTASDNSVRAARSSSGRRRSGIIIPGFFSTTLYR